MQNNHNDTPPICDADLADLAVATDEHGRVIDPPNSPLFAQLSSTRKKIGTWDRYGVRVLTNEADAYASIHFRIPKALPAASAARLQEFSTQRIPYTDRDREWDAVMNGGVTSNPAFWNCFIESVLTAIDFAHAAIESAVWAHARGEEWHWPYAAPGRIEDKYAAWDDEHPFTYDPSPDSEFIRASAPSGDSADDAADDVSF